MNTDLIDAIADNLDDNKVANKFISWSQRRLNERGPWQRYERMQDKLSSLFRLQITIHHSTAHSQRVRTRINGDDPVQPWLEVVINEAIPLLEQEIISNG